MKCLSDLWPIIGHVTLRSVTLAAVICASTLAASAVVRGGQGQPPPPSPAPAPTSAPGTAWTVWTKDGRQPLGTTSAGGREMVSLEELTRLFGLEVREDAVTRGLAIGVQGRTIVVSAGQGLASIGGRVVTLSAPPQRSGRTWLVPLDFLDRVLALVYQPRLDVRPRSRLVVVGDVRVPRVTVRLETSPSQARVTVETSPPTPHGVVQEPGRLVVRFEAEALDLELAAATSPDLVLALRQLPGSPAFAIDLGPRFASFRASDGPVEGAVQRLTVDIAGAAEPAPATPSPTPQEPAPATPGAPAPPPPPLTVEPVASIRTVVIDPGHGGEEEGAKGPGGTLEKHVSLAVSKLLKSALEARLGVRVLMTREDDRTVKRDERAAFANNNKADLFISMHANASVSRTPSGAEVFYLSLDGYSPEARRVAMREGAVLPTVTGGDRQIELILWEMAQVQHIASSAAFAGLIEQALRARVKMTAGAIQQAPFSVLVGANMPAVLVEIGFISNPTEEKLLSTPVYQQKIVDALVESVVRFREVLDAQRRGEAGAAPTPRLPEAAAPSSPRTP
jgi:N-acetylmuramoyl-L-alanine amidase